MEKIMGTVDENWRCSLAEQILQNWTYDEGSVYFYRASANTVCVFKSDTQLRFLRFTFASEKEFTSLESEIKILLSLKDSDVKVALPIASKAGDYIEIVETELGKVYAVVFEGLTGDHIDIEEMNDEQFCNWGKTLGQLHNKFKSLPTNIADKRSSHQEQLKFVRDNLPAQEVAAFHELDFVSGWIENLPKTNENYGLIHYDFELDNLCWNDNVASILDFDDCMMHWYVADIAFSLRDLFEEGYDSTNLKFLEFLKGYESETNLGHSILEDLSWFYRYHNLVTFASLLQTVDVSQGPEKPVWLNGLIEKLENKISKYREGFGEI
ncbi:phosphotransferase enzyme family protein [Fredinandcohnia sp. 179-A 10B2 NHS]|uniref:phosphotransferase enzyme family protein n=1 Tax=Fredinandcohnia sp. 179-A 10B2 NHS TaxID=3235176 RepID=UPI0039A237D9